MEAGDREARVIAGLFEQATGQQLGRDRTWRIGTTLTPLCHARNIPSLATLAAMLEHGGDDSLLADVVDALLNNETSFFRDAAVFTQLTNHVLPQLAVGKQRERRLRIWSAACSTGQEAYSLAMIFAENEARWRGWTIDIVGTDMSRAAVARARSGLYSQFEIQRGLSMHRMIAFFDPVPEQGWRVKRSLASMVNFGRHNLLGSLPARPAFDLILCRNALLYFSAERRVAVLDRLAGSIAPQGALMLGAGETAAGSDRFRADPAALTIFRPADMSSVVDRAA
jgi:chemotaxis protein methyltransferase CheR